MIHAENAVTVCSFFQSRKECFVRFFRQQAFPLREHCFHDGLRLIRFSLRNDREPTVTGKAVGIEGAAEQSLMQQPLIKRRGRADQNIQRQRGKQ